jgi:hypothetical protein
MRQAFIINPVRSRQVIKAEDYEWSSHANTDGTY